ncbi:NADH-quinone oxidoreductase subunit N [Pedobacter sp. BS3]|uniref:NADH-quinone oxidoreductase subunit N n=1 Tax=Pedobacter sp. BS3 TaxID=2567937 RepID=UPI0011EE1C47|nr:NADH-quinone oxidoreductase subunit N [Pedobacter sp. BS3]TZF81896.1 NADH-quinone oxidoreductase subunit N [Pedobacter sp. BS3]
MQQSISQSINEILYGLGYLLPELALTALFIIVIITGLFTGKRADKVTGIVSFTGLLIAGYFTAGQLTTESTVSLFGGMIALSRLAVYLKLILLLCGMLFLLFTQINAELQQHKKGLSDLYAIVIATLLGMNFMAMTANLLMLYLSVEMVSVGSYLMVGYVSSNTRQSEAAIKYALFGAVCSAVMLYGISLLYSFTGTLVLDNEFIANLRVTPQLGASLAVLLVLAGIGFKLSFVPLHFWTPDIYEGASTPVTAFLSTAGKVAAFGVVIRFLLAFSPRHGFLIVDFQQLLSIIAIITMIIGNFAAIWQDNIKRMLAYSSIGHTGFIMMALIAFSDASAKAMIFYLFVYTLMNMAAFMLADYIEQKTGTLKISEYKGFGKKLPLAFCALVIVLLSLIGFPATAGFIAKVLVFSSALELYNFSGSVLLLILMAMGALTTVVSLFYYFKIPLFAYLKKPDAEPVIFSLPKNAAFGLYISAGLALLLVVFGLFPQLVNGWVELTIR